MEQTKKFFKYKRYETRDIIKNILKKYKENIA